MKTCCIILLSLMIAVSAFALPISKSEEAIDLAAKNLLPNGRDNVVMKVWGPLPAGTIVQGTKELVTTTPADGYIV